jgi:NAD(P)H-hydrate epimerase
MASGGMGDILSGICGAVLAQFIPLGLTPLAAAKLACCVHSKAADEASLDGGEIGLLATDLLPCIRYAIQTRSEPVDVENKQND